MIRLQITGLAGLMLLLAACACPEGTTPCGDLCVDTRVDEANCGACGTSCAAGEICSAGVCAVACPADEVKCGGNCVDPLTDRAFCGASGACASDAEKGAACASGEVCSAGKCAVSCQAGLVNCGGKCVDPLTDRAGCGACGITCASGEVCSAGKCAVSCQAGLVNCGGKCVDPLTDRAFCGAANTCTGAEAGAQCGSGQVCSAGTCALSCQAGLVNCNGRCIDPLTDRAYCGASSGCFGVDDGTMCAAGEVCAAGTCTLSCQVGLVNCDGGCVDPLTDRAYCGASNSCSGAEAGTQCGSGQVCSAGVCAVSCQAGLVNCGGKCVDPMTDRAFCGASNACAGAEAGTQCGSGQVCSAGVCAVSCQAGLVNCGGKCVDPLTDRAFCGSSGACVGAAAGSVCASGQICSAGACAVSCQSGLVNCGGKCVDPMSDRAFCGASGACTGAAAGSTCTSGQVCSAGVCAVSCLPGLVNCGGRCIDPLTDRAFCGASGSCQGASAGTPCGAGTCTAGACRYAAPGLTGLSTSSGALSPQFAAETLHYVLTVSGLARSITVTPATSVPGAIITVNGATVTSGQRSAPIALNGSGITSIAIRVTSQGGSVDYSVLAVPDQLYARGYFKASNTESWDLFGYSVAMDGDTLVVGAVLEDSAASGVNGSQTDNTASGSGAAYVFTRANGVWTQQAYLKPFGVPAHGGDFGHAVAISGDTVAVGARLDSFSSAGVGGFANTSSGAVYVFTRSNGTWTPQARLKASNAANSDKFGSAIALHGDTLAVGAEDEDSAATVIDGDQSDDSASNSGAVYVFTRTGGTWTQQAYVKASNTRESSWFGKAVALSGDTLAVGATGEASAARGVNGNAADTSAGASGAVYVFTRANGAWSQQAYIKASNTESGDLFGASVALDGDTLVAGAWGEDGASTGVNGNQASNNASSSGAAYAFTRTSGTWSQQAYLKASNTGANDWFGTSVAVRGDLIVVGAHREGGSVARGPTDNSATDSGAAYVFERSAGSWSEVVYLKAPNGEAGDQFGSTVAISGRSVLIGGSRDASAATGVNGNAADNSAGGAGAAYLWTPAP